MTNTTNILLARQLKHFTPSDELINAVQNDDLLLEIIANSNEYNPDIDNYTCFGQYYWPKSRRLYRQDGTWIPDPDYDPQNDICGRKCIAGLYKPELESDEIQGDCSCLILKLFVDKFKIALPESSCPNNTRIRYNLYKAIPQILSRVLKQGDTKMSTLTQKREFVLDPSTHIVHQGFIWNTKKMDYEKWDDGSAVEEKQIKKVTPPPPPVIPTTPPMPTLPPVPPMPQIQSAPPMPQIPPIPSMPQIVPTPSMPQIPSMPPMPTIPTTQITAESTETTVTKKSKKRTKTQPTQVAESPVQTPSVELTAPAQPPAPAQPQANESVIPAQDTPEQDQLDVIQENEPELSENELDSKLNENLQAILNHGGKLTAAITTIINFIGAKLNNKNKPTNNVKVEVIEDNPKTDSELVKQFRKHAKNNFTDLSEFNRDSLNEKFLKSATDEDLKKMLSILGIDYSGYNANRFHVVARSVISRKLFKV